MLARSSSAENESVRRPLTMEDRGSTPIPVNWTGLILLAAATLGGVWWLQSPLKSSRPAHEELLGVAIFPDRPAARLWEDPFDVVLRRRNQERLDTVKRHEDPLDFEINSQEPLLVLPVTVMFQPVRGWCRMANKKSGCSSFRVGSGRLRARRQ